MEPTTSDLGTDLAPLPEPAAPGSPGTGAVADLPRDRPLRAGFLVVDGVYNTELAAPYDVLQHTVFHAKPGIEVFTVSPNGQPVTTFEGIRIAPHYSFANAPPIDILVVPSARGSMDKDLENRAMIDWVRQTAGRARHVMSLCDGAFVLARAGLLDGVPATTFPEDYDRLVQMFPKVELRVNVSFVDAGKILTSQGGARSYDVAMHLVDKLYGQKVAQGIGKGLLIPWPPDPDTMPRSVEPQALTPAPASP
jgi:transcriptional regulator GlxA family with amidase domain